ncbi:amidase [Starkeya koreensis]|uniref:Indoleacetamide hydrolase n=1 Tax=Ancylobacter koreensis TaxID=266121 RepID=A0ABT0DL09_9HYPH|nr:amidase [Ancylobacter koreensis]MCK0207971.1 amidase [Ancylobacter koreensis]
MAADVLHMTATEMARLLRDGEIGAVEVTRAALERIEAVNPALNAFCLLLPERALAQAADIDARRVRGEPLGPLAGLPVALKDYTPTAGLTTTYGSRLFAGHVPERDAVIARRLVGAGGVLVGKTTTPEFADSWFTRGAQFGVTRNPWDPSRTPGGSSGGSAVAVATGCVALAEGCDMAGSIRGPAAFCGIVGLKPALGRIPFDALPTTFDDISHFGPMARTVNDAALFLGAVAGPDPADLFSYLPPLELSLPVEADASRMKLAFSPDLGFCAVDPQVAREVRAAVEALRAAGATVEEVDLGWRVEDAEAFFTATLVWMAALYGDAYDRGADRLEPLTRRLIEMGREVDGVTLKRLDFVRAGIWRKLAAVLADYDALVCPTMAQPAPRLDRDDFDYGHRTADGRLAALDMTGLFNLIGACPALSVPAGRTDEGLPVGLQIVGRPQDEAGVLRVGRAVEIVRPQPAAPQPSAPQPSAPQPSAPQPCASLPSL